MMKESSMHDEIRKLKRQTAALASFGTQSLRTHDLDRLLTEACETVATSLDAELVKVLELLPDGERMLVRSGVGWNPGVVGREIFGAHELSPSGYAMQMDKPVISGDVGEELRFEIPAFMREHHVRSMVNVVIHGEHRAWGVLEVDARAPHAFDDDDAVFLQNYANLLAAAIDRLETEAALNRAVERSELLLGELQHRVRNLLLNIRSLARRTRRSSGTLDDFSEAFEARLQALGRTQDMLTRAMDGTIALEEVLRQELQAHGMDDPERTLLRGPCIELTGGAAQALALAFHELATNAGKYGAFARPEGRLSVTWEITEEPEQVVLHWRESEVEMPAEPERRGFGSETIEKSIAYMLAGEARLNFSGDGADCEIRFPLSGQGHVSGGQG
ncbi:GAF domain-containing protein [Cereibacter changlensis]|uniref:histidine kinase n=2 Tax=Cereibacter changlensis TaxID=402884 RepID=A0A4U0Z5I0_9RHOB|nr:GAF domain-containing protein [Cereibacter changlensis]